MAFVVGISDERKVLGNFDDSIIAALFFFRFTACYNLKKKYPKKMNFQ
jgi:hypothetical protein